MVEFWAGGIDDWSNAERGMWEDFDSFGVVDDPVAQAMFHEAYFNFDHDSETINTLRDAFDDYMHSEYGIDFDSVFDWDAYRESYG